MRQQSIIHLPPGNALARRPGRRPPEMAPLLGGPFCLLLVCAGFPGAVLGALAFPLAGPAGSYTPVAFTALASWWLRQALRSGGIPLRLGEPAPAAVG